MSETVFLVTKGEHDDYQVIAVFRSAERAKAFAESSQERDSGWTYRLEPFAIADAAATA